MSPTQIERRKAAIKVADAINSIEGVHVSQYAKDLSVQWANGNISAAQMKDLLVKAHRKV